MISKRKKTCTFVNLTRRQARPQPQGAQGAFERSSGQKKCFALPSIRYLLYATLTRIRTR